MSGPISCNNCVTVHPRARGEHQHRVDEHAKIGGSSPRTRGTYIRATGINRYSRFIPAHAGNIDCTPDKKCPQSVHPRARGEHAGPTGSTAFAGGSSPRTRGTCIPIRYVSRTPRFIPAHAGNMSYLVPEVSMMSVHPRARGEHTSHNLPFYMTKFLSKNSTDFFGWIRHSRGERF